MVAMCRPNQVPAVPPAAAAYTETVELATTAEAAEEVSMAMVAIHLSLVAAAVVELAPEEVLTIVQVERELAVRLAGSAQRVRRQRISGQDMGPQGRRAVAAEVT